MNECAKTRRVGSVGVGVGDYERASVGGFSSIPAICTRSTARPRGRRRRQRKKSRPPARPRLARSPRTRSARLRRTRRAHEGLSAVQARGELFDGFGEGGVEHGGVRRGEARSRRASAASPRATYGRKNASTRYGAVESNTTVVPSVTASTTNAMSASSNVDDSAPSRRPASRRFKRHRSVVDVRAVVADDSLEPRRRRRLRARWIVRERHGARRHRGDALARASRGPRRRRRPPAPSIRQRPNRRDRRTSRARLEDYSRTFDTRTNE